MFTVSIFEITGLLLVAEPVIAMVSTSLSVEDESAITSPDFSESVGPEIVSLPVVRVGTSGRVPVVSVKVWPAVAPPPDLIEVIVEATLVVAAEVVTPVISERAAVIAVVPV